MASVVLTLLKDTPRDGSDHEGERTLDSESMKLRYCKCGDSSHELKKFQNGTTPRYRIAPEQPPLSISTSIDSITQPGTQ